MPPLHPAPNRECPLAGTDGHVCVTLDDVWHALGRLVGRAEYDRVVAAAFSDLPWSACEANDAITRELVSIEQRRADV